MDNLQSWNDLRCILLECGKKLDYPEEKPCKQSVKIQTPHMKALAEISTSNLRTGRQMLTTSHLCCPLFQLIDFIYQTFRIHWHYNNILSYCGFYLPCVDVSLLNPPEKTAKEMKPGAGRMHSGPDPVYWEHTAQIQIKPFDLEVGYP